MLDDDDEDDVTVTKPSVQITSVTPGSSNSRSVRKKYNKLINQFREDNYDTTAQAALNYKLPLEHQTVNRVTEKSPSLLNSTSSSANNTMVGHRKPIYVRKPTWAGSVNHGLVVSDTSVTSNSTSAVVTKQIPKTSSVNQLASNMKHSQRRTDSNAANMPQPKVVENSITIDDDDRGETADGVKPLSNGSVAETIDKENKKCDVAITNTASSSVRETEIEKNELLDVSSTSECERKTEQSKEKSQTTCTATEKTVQSSDDEMSSNTIQVVVDVHSLSAKKNRDPTVRLPRSSTSITSPTKTASFNGQDTQPCSPAKDDTATNNCEKTTPTTANSPAAKSEISDKSPCGSDINETMTDKVEQKLPSIDNASVSSASQNDLKSMASQNNKAANCSKEPKNNTAEVESVKNDSQPSGNTQSSDSTSKDESLSIKDLDDILSFLED